jgi:hypothetical protein
MIRYGPNTRAELEALVDAHNAGWRAKAATRTATLVANKTFSEDSSIWGEIKPVFMRLQALKCAFCERPLGGFLAGSGEHDVEHFRPKGKIRAWPYPSRKPKVSYGFPTGAKSDTGYYWLAYDLQNYAAACRPCNASRKADYFPIAGARGKATETIAALKKTEGPFLLFPLGAHGDDPADYISFEGILAVPRHKSGAKHDRAQVTIDFFSLNDREELWADRFRAIRSLFYALRLSQTDPDADVRADARRAIGEAVSDDAPQAACARAFLTVAQTDAKAAWATYQAAEAFIQTKAPKALAATHR